MGMEILVVVQVADATTITTTAITAVADVQTLL
jgi:hypothetical protein